MSRDADTHGHIHKDYQQQLDELRERLLTMAGRVEEMIAKSIQALTERDVELAEQTIASDRRVNRDEMDIDELCVVILAKRQPMAGDLRFITIALKMVTDLERIADLAVNICQRTTELSNLATLGPYRDIPEMAENVQVMVKDAIDAFVASDVAAAQAVIDRDDRVDQLYHLVNRELIDMMRHRDDIIPAATRVQSIAKHLERMADHTTNLAEHVIYMVRGQDIRHPHNPERR